jgi:hypothetical protein
MTNTKFNGPLWPEKQSKKKLLALLLPILQRLHLDFVLDTEA